MLGARGVVEVVPCDVTDANAVRLIHSTESTGHRFAGSSSAMVSRQPVSRGANKPGKVLAPKVAGA